MQPDNNAFARARFPGTTSPLFTHQDPLMTYCVALKLNDGLVFLSDTRTNAGVDNISRVKKLFTWSNPGERAICMMTAGNLGITQAVISELNEQLERPKQGEINLMTAESMYDVVQIVAEKMRNVQAEYGPGLAARGVDSGATMIVGGQRAGGVPRLFMVYAAGNFIEAMDDAPYFQIGEHKYGKPIIDRVIHPQTPLQDGIICALLSMDSTLRSNLTVGMPLDLAVIRSSACQFEQNRRIDENDPAFRQFSDQWSQQLRNAFQVMREMQV